MRQFQATVTQRSQVTIPAAVRRTLGVGPRDKVTFVVEGDEVRLTPVEYTLESVFGSIKPLPGAAIDIDEQIEQAKEERAEQLMEKMRRGLA